jgi:phenylacetic acid degradation operon negative regulatory protein
MKGTDLLFGLLISFHKNEYSFSDIRWLTLPFSISETSLRTNLSRMESNGTIRIKKKGKRAFYSLTDKSVKLSSNISLSFSTPDWSGWNNDWWGISVSLPEEKNELRYYIHKKISSHRFALLHPGFWIRPYNKIEKTEERLKTIIDNHYVKTMRFQFYTSEDMSKVTEIWKINQINSEFKSCLTYISNSYKSFNLDDSKEALRGKMIVGDYTVKQLFKDPLLPDIFLPSDWKGNAVRKSFKEWDKLTTLKSKPYWEKIYEK